MEGRGGSAVAGSGAGAAGAAGIIGAGAIVAHPPARRDAAMHSVRRPFIERLRNPKAPRLDPKESGMRAKETTFDANLGGKNRRLARE